MRVTRLQAATKHLLSFRDLMEMFGIGESTLDNWIKEGVIPPPIRPGGVRGKRFWPTTTVETFMATMNGEQPVASGADTGAGPD
jgi:predicted DNA-binding transcriptional regulator AlpA